MKKLIIAIGTAMSVLSLISCNDEPKSDIKKFPLNYTITEVKATSNIAVGCLIVDPYNDFKSNATRWDRLTDEYDPANGKIGPYVRPAASPDAMYAIMGSDADEQDEHARQIGRIVEEMKKARIDFTGGRMKCDWWDFGSLFGYRELGEMGWKNEMCSDVTGVYTLFTFSR